MDERGMTCGEWFCDTELEKLRKEALSAIMRLSEQRQIVLWNVLHRLPKEKEVS